jgi:hypothetical protein
MTRFTDTLNIPLGTTGNYSAIANLHTLQFTVTHTHYCPQSATLSTSRFLVTDFNIVIITVSLSLQHTWSLLFTARLPTELSRLLRYLPTANSETLNPILCCNCQLSRCHFFSIIFAELNSRLLTWNSGTWLILKVKVTLRLAVYRQSVRLDVRPLEAHDQRLFFQLNSCGNSSYVTSSLTKRWGCLLWICLTFRQLTHSSESESYVTTDDQSASLSWYKAPIRSLRPDFFSVRNTEYVWKLRSWFRGAPSLTRGRVCLLYVPLALASAVFLGS